MRHIPAASTSRAHTDPVVMELENVFDMSFVGKVRVGAQNLKVIPDTGSFEIVVLGDECAGCGSKQHLFHVSKTGSSFELGNLSSVQSYGSGQTFSTVAYDSIALGNPDQLVVERQMFWLTTKAKMQVAKSSSFAGIFGLGSPSTAVQMAQFELKKVKSVLDEMSPEDREPYLGTLDNLKKVAHFEKKVQFWHEQTHMRTFSICLGPERGSSGKFFFNDPQPSVQPEVFTTVNARGFYWSTPLVNMRVETAHRPIRACERSEECLAIMDTGTSLIGAPYGFTTDIVELVENNTRKYGCDDLSQWPYMDFHLGGKPFSLSPSSYVGKFTKDQDLLREPAEDELDSRAVLKALMPHLSYFEDMHNEIHGAIEVGEAYCAPLVFVLDQQQGEGPSWLFGLPFFREYYTSFELSPTSDHMHQMHFTKADANCKPLPLSTMQSVMPQAQAHMPTFVDPAHIRFPRLAVLYNKELLKRHMMHSTFFLQH